MTTDAIAELKPRQRALIEALSSFPYPRLNEAAAALNIPIDTAKKWHRDPGFRAALRTDYRGAADETRLELERRISGLADSAVAALIGAITSNDELVRLRAAGAVIDRVLGKPAGRTEITGKDGEPIQIRQEIDIFQATVLAAIGEAAPDVRKRIEDALRRHQPVRQLPG